MSRRFGSDDRAFVSLATWIILSATVYVWASGFGAQSSEPATTISVTSAGAIADGVKTYTVAAASAGLSYDDLRLTRDGRTLSFQTDVCEPSPGAYSVCRGSSPVARAAGVEAGDSLRVGGVEAGETLRFIDVDANTVIMTLTIG